VGRTTDPAYERDRRRPREEIRYSESADTAAHYVGDRSIEIPAYSLNCGWRFIRSCSANVRPCSSGSSAAINSSLLMKQLDASRVRVSYVTVG
jgi:hypothetical protein